METEVYEVKPHDTVAGIALRYKMKVEELKRLNSLIGNNLFSGQKLRVRSTKKPQEDPAFPGGAMDNRGRRYLEHIVQPQETLSSIALTYGCFVNELKTLNNLPHKRIQVSQVLKIPMHSDQSVRAFPKPQTPLAPRGTVPHIVQKRENLKQIAQFYNVPESLLADINQLRGTVLRPSQVIYVIDGRKRTTSELRGQTPNQKAQAPATANRTRTHQRSKSSEDIGKQKREEPTDNDRERAGKKIDPSAVPSFIQRYRNVFSASSDKFWATAQEQAEQSPPKPSKLTKKLLPVLKDSPKASPKSSPKASPRPSPKASPRGSVGGAKGSGSAKSSPARSQEGPIECTAVILIPHTSEFIVCLCVALPDRMQFTFQDDARVEELKCPREIPLRHVMHAKVVKNAQVAHAAFTPRLNGVGVLQYLQIVLGPLTDSAHCNYYVGVEKVYCEPLCYYLLKYICEAALLAANEPTRAVVEEVGVPRFTEPSVIFTDKMNEGLKLIRNNLPMKYRFYTWQLIYSTDRDGISLRTFYRNLELWSVSLLFIEDSRGYVFGAFASGVWRPGDTYVGSGESFLFQLWPEAQLYPWLPHSNSCFMLGKLDHIEMGAGGNAGLWLDKDFNQGYSGESDTFANRPLASDEDFTCAVFEVWSFSSSSDYY